MEDVTLNLDAQHADILRRQIAYKCGSEAEILRRAADDYYTLAMSPGRDVAADISSFRASMEVVQTWGGLLNALRWDAASDTAGESRTFAGPREQLQDLLVTGLQIAVERLDEIQSLGEERPSRVVRRKAEEMEVFEELLDRVGWPDPAEETS